ncbi:GNAT family N-acetyltransferase [Propionibacterium sp.]|uniref:GNAT family N-acetyltransferase n=1 Tax=Propionibacterium sp. TaxID=1977903 RepID=UPI0039ECF857
MEDLQPAASGTPVCLEGPRLVLRGVDPAEAELLAGGVCPLPCAPDYPHVDTGDAARLLRHSLEVDNWIPGFGMYLIVRRDDGLVIGDIGFHTPPDERGAAEVAYGLAVSGRGQGYATEALAVLTEWAHGHGCATVLAEVDPGNTASLAVLEHCGYRQVRSTGPTLRLRHQSS